ncbi:MAG: hypothetical protein KF773_14940 [Deltaproteobacteria bacterium]|nr:hypothetical protein [Deltaproteobacteria bacterium]MCW5806966.1 hypothetical protein [Deltaproteobacteria bacterium]
MTSTIDPDENQEMARWQRGYVIAMCAIIGGAFAYAACEWGSWPKLRYEPLHEHVGFAGSPHIAIMYWGIALWGFGGAVCGALAGAILCRVFARPWPERVLHLFGAWAITAIVLAGGYFTWSLWPW